MSFFFQKKPKQFDYKPIYTEKEELKDSNLSDKMYDQWNRASYAELLKAGNFKIIITIAIGAVLIFAGITLYDYLIHRIN